MLRIALPLLALFAVPAFADEPADAPVAAPAEPSVVSSSSPSASDAPVAAQPVSLASNPTRPMHWASQYAIGVGAGIISVPISVYLAQWFGSLSNSLIWAAIPALLCMGLIAPVAVTVATWLAGNWNAKGTFGFWVPMVATFVVNAVAFVIAGFAGVTAGAFGRVVLFTIAEALILPAVSTGTMRLMARAPQGQPVTMRDPVSSSAWVVPMSEVSF